MKTKRKPSAVVELTAFDAIDALRADWQRCHDVHNREEGGLNARCADVESLHALHA